MKSNPTYDLKIQGFKTLRLGFHIFILVGIGLLYFTASAIGQEILSEDKENIELKPKTVLVLGDSLSAGYGLPPGQSFPDILEDWLNENNTKVRVINAGVSGDTSQGGRSRIEWVYSSIPDGGPDLVIIEFGGNDALRGIEPSLTRTNIEAMVTFLTDKNTPLLLAGMQAPPNMGAEYEQEFNILFHDISKKYDISFYPFFLEGVGGIPELNQRDGMHPNEAGVKIIVEKIGPQIAEILGER